MTQCSPCLAELLKSPPLPSPQGRPALTQAFFADSPMLFGKGLALILAVHLPQNLLRLTVNRPAAMPANPPAIPVWPGCTLCRIHSRFCSLERTIVFQGPGLSDLLSLRSQPLCLASSSLARRVGSRLPRSLFLGAPRQAHVVLLKHCVMCKLWRPEEPSSLYNLQFQIHLQIDIRLG